VKKQIEALQDAYQHLLDAHKCVQMFGKLRKHNDPGGVCTEITKLACAVTRMCEDVCAERERQNDRIYGNGILRVKVCGGSHTKEVTVQRPDNSSDTPYITEASFNAIAFAFGTRLLRTDAGFDIDVLSANGRKVGTIKSDK